MSLKWFLLFFLLLRLESVEIRRAQKIRGDCGGAAGKAAAMCFHRSAHQQMQWIRQSKATAIHCCGIRKQQRPALVRASKRSSAALRGGREGKTYTRQRTSSSLTCKKPQAGIEDGLVLYGCRAFEGHCEYKNFTKAFARRR